MLAKKMAKSVPALVNCDVLRWARESAGVSVDEVTKRLKYTSEQLAQWEDGSAFPTMAQLRKLAGLYKRPIAVFYLSKPPKKFQALHDFRRTPEGEQEGDSSQFRFEIRRAEFRRDAALELLATIGEKPAAFPLRAELGDDPEATGAALRKALGIGVGEAKSWSDQGRALRTWREALESRGVLVFQARNVESKEFRALSIASSPLPVVLLNIKDSPAGRTFSLLHEAAHLALRRGGVCNLREPPKPTSPDERIEVFCNAVAAAALMPKDEFLRTSIFAGSTAMREDWTDSEIRTLTRTFWVSREAAVRRMATLGRTSPAFYRRKRLEYEKERPASRPKSSPIPQSVIALAVVGPMFARLVLEGYSRESITSSDVSEYLGVKLKHIPKIELALVKSTEAEYSTV